MKNFSSLLTISVALGMSCYLNAAKLAVVANAKSPLATLSQDDLADIYLGKKKSAGGTPVMPVDQASGAALRSKFYDDIVGKSGSQLKAYWAKLVFTGKGVPPKEVGDDVAVKSYVMENINGIGYIDANMADGNVKVLFKASLD